MVSGKFLNKASEIVISLHITVKYLFRVSNANTFMKLGDGLLAVYCPLISALPALIKGNSSSSCLLGDNEVQCQI